MASSERLRALQDQEKNLQSLVKSFSNVIRPINQEQTQDIITSNKDVTLLSAEVITEEITKTSAVSAKNIKVADKNIMKRHPVWSNRLALALNEQKLSILGGFRDWIRNTVSLFPNRAARKRSQDAVKNQLQDRNKSLIIAKTSLLNVKLLEDILSSITKNSESTQDRREKSRTEAKRHKELLEKLGLSPNIMLGGEKGGILKLLSVLVAGAVTALALQFKFYLLPLAKIISTSFLKVLKLTRLPKVVLRIVKFFDELLGKNKFIVEFSRKIFRGFKSVFGVFKRFVKSGKNAVSWVGKLLGKSKPIVELAGKISEGFKSVFGVFKRFGKIFKFIPVLGTIITIIEGIVGAFRGFFNTQGSLTEKLSGAVQGIFAQIIEGLTFGFISFEGVMSFFQSFIDQAVLLFTEPGKFFANIGNWLVDVTKAGWRVFMDLLTVTFPALISDLGGWFWDIIVGITDSIKQLMWRMITDPFGLIVDVIKDAVGWITRSLEFLHLIDSEEERAQKKRDAEREAHKNSAAGKSVQEQIRLAAEARARGEHFRIPLAPGQGSVSGADLIPIPVTNKPPVVIINNNQTAVNSQGGSGKTTQIYAPGNTRNPRVDNMGHRGSFSR